MESVESSVLEEVWQIASESESNKAFKVDYTIDNGTKSLFMRILLSRMLQTLSIRKIIVQHRK